MNPSDVVEQLQAKFPPDRLLTAKADVLPYGFDGTPGLKQLPAAVVFPLNASQVQTVVEVAGSTHTPIVSRGSGTGLAGGSVPVAGCIVLCLLKMDRVLEIDTHNLTLMVEPGVITKSIDELTAKHGLFYPPDPSSMKVSTIGGNVANNSGGLRGLKYGVTRDYVMGIEVVTADGRIQCLGSKCVKDVAGYSLRDLFIGSEGTLGIITKILLKLVPRPQTKRTLLATFPSMAAAADAAAIYNITQPEQSAKLLDRKMAHIANSGAQMVATSNPGCHLQIQSGIAQCGLDVSVRQPVNPLAAAYRAETASLG